MVKGEDYGNGCLGDGFCFVRRNCENDCNSMMECSCGRRYTVYNYIRHSECPHNCQLIQCKCNEFVPQFELDNNAGICNECNDATE